MATNRYSNGKIYRLVNSVDDECYVGSTCMPLAKRFYQHKHYARKQGARRVYQYLNEVGWENVNIVLLEEYPCESKMELERQERYWIEELKPKLNKYVPTRTQQEWRAENAEKVREAQAQYCAKNADKLRKAKAKYRVENADKLRQKRAKYYAENADKVRERLAKYNRENADKVRESKAKYNRENREKINARRRELHAEKKAQST